MFYKFLQIFNFNLKFLIENSKPFIWRILSFREKSVEIYIAVSCDSEFVSFTRVRATKELRTETLVSLCDDSQSQK